MGLWSADGAVDFAVHFGGLFEVGGALDGLAAAAFVEVGGDGLHEGAEDGVAGGPGDGAVKADVVNEVLLGVVEGGVHLGISSRRARLGARRWRARRRGRRGLDSRTRRASNICQGREVMQGSKRTVRELESKAGGPEETKVPAPWRL